MELATVHVKLSGLSQNIVVKHRVTPAQLAMIAYMHGEDCVQSLNVTSVDKVRTSRQELDRLRLEFTSEHAQKCLATLFPGMHPQLPTSFRAIGYDPEVLRDERAPAYAAPQPQNNSATAIQQKIKAAEENRKSEQNGTAPLSPVSVVTPQDMTDILDDTGDDEDEDDGDNALDLGDDPIDAEVNRMNLPPAPAAGE